MQHAIRTTAVVDRGAPAAVSTAPHGPIRRRPARPDPRAVTVVALGATVRLAWLAYARPEPVSDFRHYLHAGYALLDTGVFGIGHPTAWRLPAYPAVLAAGAVVSRHPLALAALTVGIGVIQIALTWWVAWRIFGSRPAAGVAAGVAALAPSLVTFAPVLASEHLLAVCVLGALGVAIGPRDAADTSSQRGHRDARHTRTAAVPTWPRALLAGVLLGAGVLTRGEALAYVPVVALVAAGRRLRSSRRIASAARAAAVVVLGVALVAAPWVVRNERVVGPGAGLSTTGGFNFYLAHSPGAYGWRTPLPLPLLVADEVTRNELGWRYGLRYVRRHPDDWWPTVRQGTRELLAPSTYAARYATVTRDPASGRVTARVDLASRATAIALAERSSRWLLWAGLLGVAFVPCWRRSGWVAVLGVVVANWALYAVVFWAQARYRFVVDALACVSVGAAAVAAGAVRVRIRARRRMRATARS
jgi:hypothetical protein